MHRRRGTLLEVPVTVAGYAVLIALFAPQAPVWRLVLLGLVGLGLAHFYCNTLLGEPHKVLGLAVYVWVYALLSLLTGLLIWAGFPPAVFSFAVLPYLSFRVQLGQQKS